MLVPDCWAEKIGWSAHSLYTFTQGRPFRVIGRGHGSEGTLNEAARLLKERTSATHTRVEAGLDLLEAAVDPARLATVVERFSGFWSGTEPVLDQWAARHHGQAADLQWIRRRRGDRLRRDLDVLADLLDTPAPAVSPAPAVFHTVGTAEVLGWLYVSEGSTLGGAVIDRVLRRNGLRLRLGSFVPYDEGPGPMWLAYLDRLEQWTAGDPDRTDAVVAAGVRTFDALADWLTPAGKGVAA